MRRSSAVLVVSICGALSASAPALAQEGRAGDAIPGKYIVVAQEGRDPAAVARWQNARDRQCPPLVNGFAATLDAAQVRALRASARVAYVEPDRVVTADVTQNMDANGDPWGLDRIDQRTPAAVAARTRTTAPEPGVTAYVIDTGINHDHPQFGGRARHRLSTRSAATGADCHGHGTHVAGTIGGTTYGVAKSVSLRGVRVLGCTGSGSTSGIISGARLGARQRGPPAGGQHVARRRPLDGAEHGDEQPGQLGRVHRRGGRQREPERLQRLPRLGGRRLHDGGVGPDRPAGVVLELRLVRRRLRAGRGDQVGLARHRHEHDQRHVDGHPARGRRRARSTRRPPATRPRRTVRTGSTRNATAEHDRSATRAGRRTGCCTRRAL